MTDPAQIAKSLSETQRLLLLDLPSGMDATPFWNKDKRLRTYRVLLRKGLADTFGAITPRGLAVRAILEKTP